MAYLESLTEHSWLLSSIFILTYIGSLLLMPIIVVMLPNDYFSHAARRPALWAHYHPVLRLMLLLIKNLLGVMLLLAGIAMLVLPGQGLLTLLAGVLLLDFPGKYHCESWLVSRPPIFKTVNWLRKKSGRHSLELPTTREQG